MFDYHYVSIDRGTLKAFVSPEEKEIYRPARAYRHREALYNPKVTECSAVYLDIPEGIDTIGEGALEMCFALCGITLPESMEIIGVRAFLYCNNLEEITFPGNLKTIRREAFAHCTSLTRLHIPDSVKIIGESAFAGCTKLREIHLPDQFCGKVNAIFGGDVEVRMYSAVCSGKLKVNPSLVSGLENSMRKKWDSAIDILISSGNCEMTRRYLALWEDEPVVVAVEKLDAAIEQSVTAKTTDITALLMDYKNQVYPAALLEDMRQREMEKVFGKTTVAEWRKRFHYRTEEDGLVITLYKGDDPVVEVPSVIGRKPVIAIERWLPASAEEPDKPYQVVLPQGLREIREQAFLIAENMTEINIPETVTEIGASAFEECFSLKEIDIPEGVSSIQKAVFAGCGCLSSVTIPESVSSISWDAFRGCDSLQEVELPAYVSQIDTSGCEKRGFPKTVAVVPKGSQTEQTIRNTPIPYRLE